MIPRRRALAAVPALALAFALGDPAAACTRPPEAQAMTAELARLVNDARAASGARPLAVSDSLLRAADRHACDMALSGIRSHHGSDGSTFAARFAAAGARCSLKAENIGWGPRSARAMFDAWMASGQHRTNMLHPRMRNLAVSVTRAPSGEILWVLALAC